MDTEYLQQCPGPRHCIVGLSLTTAISNARYCTAYLLTKLRLATIHCSIVSTDSVMWSGTGVAAYWLYLRLTTFSLCPLSTVLLSPARNPIHLASSLTHAIFSEPAERAALSCIHTAGLAHNTQHTNRDTTLASHFMWWSLYLILLAHTIVIISRAPAVYPLHFVKVLQCNYLLCFIPTMASVLWADPRCNCRSPTSG